MKNHVNAGRVVITGVLLIVAYIFLECFVHGYLLKDMYQATAALWRPEMEMQQMMWMMMVAQGIFAFMFAVIYACGYVSNKPRIGQGFRFGLLIALLVAPAMSLSWYVILPIPQILAIYWFVAGFVEMIILGLIAGVTYKA